VNSLTLRHIPNPLLLCPLWEANHHAFGASVHDPPSLALWYISRRGQAPYSTTLASLRVTCFVVQVCFLPFAICKRYQSVNQLELGANTSCNRKANNSGTQNRSSREVRLTSGHNRLTRINGAHQGNISTLTSSSETKGCKACNCFWRTSVTPATSTNSPSVAGASAEKNIDKNAAAALATNQPSDHEIDKETTNQPIVDSTTTVREANVEND